MKTEIGNIERFYTKTGLERFRVVVEHYGLGKIQEIKGQDAVVVRQKAQNKAKQFDGQWQRQVERDRKKAEREAQAAHREQRAAVAEARSQEAAEEWDALDGILAHTLSVDDRVDWETLKRRDVFEVPRPKPPEKLVLPPVPREAARPEPEPPAVGLFAKLLDLFMPNRVSEREEETRIRHEKAVAAWEKSISKLRAQHAEQVKAAEDEHARSVAAFESALSEWHAEKEDFELALKEQHQSVDTQKNAYLQHVPEVVEEYNDLVLSNSFYPDWFPGDWGLQYEPTQKMLIVELFLPVMDDLPTLKEVKYVKSRDELAEKHHSDAQLRKKYDSLVYQVALRTVHEVLEADVADAIDIVTFNGLLDTIDPATGQSIRPCIISLQAEKQEFEAINLGGVDPKACFRKLKGVGSSKMHVVTPVAPICHITTDDARFVDAYEVVDRLDEGENLAAMDWEDFEHLIREVFEMEFSDTGAEVKVTRASRDGGIDAVVHDPDPIRGGKTVIQAKRYTRTVGISAVRDLYGAVNHEGANKGILATTATFGPDAYSFAKDKPLVLIDGGGLLHLLQRHGYKARINLEQARAERL